MDVFVFQPIAKRESLREFNARLREFCAEKPVVAIEASTLGPNLVIQVSLADDVDADDVPTFTAVVAHIDPLGNRLEETLEAMIVQELDKHPDEGAEGEPNMPVKFIFCQGDKITWAILLCVNGMAEDDDDQGGGGDDPGDGTPTAPPEEPVASSPPSAGFQG
jgi:hypothetical protein